MRLTLIPVFLTLSLAAAEGGLAAPSSRQAWTSWTHTRPLNSGTIALLEEASERSSIITALLEEVEQTDLIVYVTDSIPGTSSGPTSHLVFLSSDAAVRYLLIRVDFLRLTPPERLVSLGHELQHALEIAIAPEVKDGLGLAQLYRRIGWEGEKDRFETESARMTGNRVRSELNGRVSASRRAMP